jgi:hypothetical protein
MDMVHLQRHLPDVAKFAICVAVGCACILKPLLDFVNGMSPRSPVLDFAVAVVTVTLPVTYIAGVILLYIHVTPPAAAAKPGAVRRFADLARALAFALIAAFFLFLVAVDSPPSSGFTPT